MAANEGYKESGYSQEEELPQLPGLFDTTFENPVRFSPHFAMSEIYY